MGAGPMGPGPMGPGPMGPGPAGPAGPMGPGGPPRRPAAPLDMGPMRGGVTLTVEYGGIPLEDGEELLPQDYSSRPKLTVKGQG
jgi:hypothetical protein